MIIQFKRKRLNYYLLIGILWFVFGTNSIISNPNRIFNYGYLGVGIIYLCTYLYENKRQYLTIENGVISKNHLIPKKINIDEIKQIRKFAGDYVLKTQLTELKINTNLIDENSLSDLNSVLESLNVDRE